MMLKFLTYKLKTHTINEDSPVNKVEEVDHDSGTESDDEQGVAEEPDIGMDSEGGSAITALSRSRSSLATPASPYFLDSALPSDCDQAYDLHSSEEELEVINSSQPSRQSTGQEKRKWSQVTPDSTSRGQIDTGPGTTNKIDGAVCGGNCCGQGAQRCKMTEIGGCCSCSSDDEVFSLVTTIPTPVQFRTSPPRGTHRPHLAAVAHHEPSPRKRHRNAAPPRPCLDFEKMQQQARSVTPWRHTGDSGSELSVYCW